MEELLAHSQLMEVESSSELEGETQLCPVERESPQSRGSGASEKQDWSIMGEFDQDWTKAAQADAPAPSTPTKKMSLDLSPQSVEKFPEAHQVPQAVAGEGKGVMMTDGTDGPDSGDEVGELQCQTCLAFDIAKSPEHGWSPAEVDMLLDTDLEGRIQSHLTQSPVEPVQAEAAAEGGQSEVLEDQGLKETDEDSNRPGELLMDSMDGSPVEGSASAPMDGSPMDGMCDESQHSEDGVALNGSEPGALEAEIQEAFRREKDSESSKDQQDDEGSVVSSAGSLQGALEGQRCGSSYWEAWQETVTYLEHLDAVRGPRPETPSSRTSSVLDFVPSDVDLDSEVESVEPGEVDAAEIPAEADQVDLDDLTGSCLAEDHVLSDEDAQNALDQRCADSSSMDGSAKLSVHAADGSSDEEHNGQKEEVIDAEQPVSDAEHVPVGAGEAVILSEELEEDLHPSSPLPDLPGFSKDGILEEAGDFAHDGSLPSGFEVDDDKLLAELAADSFESPEGKEACDEIAEQHELESVKEPALQPVDLPSPLSPKASVVSDEASHVEADDAENSQKKGSVSAVDPAFLDEGCADSLSMDGSAKFSVHAADGSSEEHKDQKVEDFESADEPLSVSDSFESAECAQEPAETTEEEVATSCKLEEDGCTADAKDVGRSFLCTRTLLRGLLIPLVVNIILPELAWRLGPEPEHFA